jgi:hypothetical protein
MADEDEELIPVSGRFLGIFKNKQSIKNATKDELLQALRELSNTAQGAPEMGEGALFSQAEQRFLETAKIGALRKFTTDNFERIKEAINRLSPKMKGRGLSVRKRRVDIIDPSMVDWNAGVKSTQRFVPFGRFIINTHRLQDDIVAIKRPKGGCLKDFPSTRIPPRLGAVIRIIVGGGVPSFEDLDELDDNERAYLHRLAKSSNISERLSIPAPKKSESDKELNEFEIMKGQIIAGNDNKDLIKKFKMLILKLSNKNVIPKPQVRELLLDLTNMGY